MKNILICYVPVFHDGYRELFQKYSKIHGKNQKNSENELWILGEDFAEKFPEIKKDIRRVSADLIKKAIESWNFFSKVKIVNYDQLKKIEINSSETQVIMPDDEMMTVIAKKFFSKLNIKYESIFLRWDKHNSLVEKKVESDGSISFEDFDQKIMKMAFKQAIKSTDWWRHVGGIIVKDGKILLAGFNKHLPSENTPYFFNDVRSLFSKGLYFELISSIHAEAMVIAEAARRGIALEGSSIYVTTFPCPVCAKQVAQAGIKKVYFSGEYSLLDGVKVLKAAGVELIRVELSQDDKIEINKLEIKRSILRKYEQ